MSTKKEKENKEICQRNRTEYEYQQHQYSKLLCSVSRPNTPLTSILTLLPFYPHRSIARAEEGPGMLLLWGSQFSANIKGGKTCQKRDQTFPSVCAVKGMANTGRVRHISLSLLVLSLSSQHVVPTRGKSFLRPQTQGKAIFQRNLNETIFHSLSLYRKT